jgi:hypothetical protein
MTPAMASFNGLRDALSASIAAPPTAVTRWQRPGGDRTYGGAR